MAMIEALKRMFSGNGDRAQEAQKQESFERVDADVDDRLERVYDLSMRTTALLEELLRDARGKPDAATSDRRRGLP
jgi:hypothetical protein